MKMTHSLGQGGNIGNASPEMEKLLKKSGVISEGSIFSNNFPKNRLKFNFFEFLSKFSQHFPTICGFRPEARKVNALAKFFEKYAKTMGISQFS